MVEFALSIAAWGSSPHLFFLIDFSSLTGVLQLPRLSEKFSSLC
jgi:hypothetical protein